MAIPDGAGGFDAAGHLLVAWDGSPAVMATLRATVPLLQVAGSVTLLTVEDEGEGVPAEAAAYLSRHGGHAMIERKPVGRDSVGATILKACADQHASYYVMGAFGHGRLRERRCLAA